MKLFFLLLILILSTKIQAQDLIGTAGENYKSDSLNLSWTIGEPLIETFENNLIITQGLLQPSITITTVSITASPEIEISLYPNPTSDVIHLKTRNTSNTELSYILFSTNGKRLKKGELSTETITISMQSYKPGTYFLHVSAHANKIKTFKILKH